MKNKYKLDYGNIVLKKCEIIEDLEQEEHTPEEIAEEIEPRMGELLDIQNEMTKEMEEYMNNIDNKQVE